MNYHYDTVIHMLCEIIFSRTLTENALYIQIRTALIAMLLI